MKRRAIILLILSGFTVCEFLYSVSLVPFGYPYRLSYNEWRILPPEEQETAYYIPEFILKIMSTDQLITSLLTNPGIIQLIASPKASTDRFTNIHVELRKRKDAPAKLFQRYTECVENADARDALYLRLILQESTYMNALSDEQKARLTG